MSEQKMPRREFLKDAAAGVAGIAVTSLPAASYARVLGANDRVRVGIVGFSDRFRQALLPAFAKVAKEFDFEIVAVGDIVMAEMTWNVNQPGRWRRPQLVAALKEEDTDWKRFLINLPSEPWDPRKYLEYRLFWPYSSGIPDQWMVHQIDTVHWFTGLP